MKPKLEIFLVILIVKRVFSAVDYQRYFVTSQFCAIPPLINLLATDKPVFIDGHRPNVIYNNGLNCQFDVDSLTPSSGLIMVVNKMNIRHSDKLTIRIDFPDSTTILNGTTGVGDVFVSKISAFANKDQRISVEFRSSLSGDLSPDNGFRLTVTDYTPTDSDGNCPPDRFNCGNGRCIDGSLRCDGVNNCGRSEDEMCATYQRQWIWALFAGLVTLILIAIMTLPLAYLKSRSVADDKRRIITGASSQESIVDNRGRRLTATFEDQPSTSYGTTGNGNGK